MKHSGSETYIVRIYRRGASKLHGTVERIGRGQAQAFSNVESLLKLLSERGIAARHRGTRARGASSATQ
jgi:hypothetical protein